MENLAQGLLLLKEFAIRGRYYAHEQTLYVKCDIPTSDSVKHELSLIRWGYEVNKEGLEVWEYYL